MIGEVRIENYKSIQKLKLELGRVTVLIGENGCGKSNILEAIALASAAASDKLDNEFLAARGVRVTEPRFMRSAFERKNLVKNIKIDIKENQGENFSYLLHNDNYPYSDWENKILSAKAIYLKNLVSYSRQRQNVISTNQKNKPEKVSLEAFKKSIKALEGGLEDELEAGLNPKTVQELLLLLGSINRMFSPDHLIDFTIYSPENQALRTFEKEGQIQPLGINGEGLFKLINVLNAEQNQDKLNQIKEKLRLIDWFKDFEVPQNLSAMQTSLQITDRYLDADLSYFDQRSSNEGFLFLLFYFTLFISELTPKFFAIDNIDASLNPRLCRRLIEELVELAKKNDKQVIFTTHNPAVLDGLDLDDDEQRLFVIYRSQLGHTKAIRILKPEPLEGQESVSLSEAFLRGYIGGLPKNF
ncbi:AAA family ATPase [Microcoleus sp. A2-C5]|uniref:AAA family ATPase n=1 Tax=unclassified Microcoleus TaxID=2642155 RepID=UPI002FD6B9BA